MGRPHWPHWATGTRGLQAGQDLAWGPADTAWYRARRVLFSPPGPGSRSYQSCTVHVAQATCTCLRPQDKPKKKIGTNSSYPTPYQGGRPDRTA